MLTQIRISVLMLAAWTLLTGLVYPLIVTGVAQAVFPGRANGSLIMRDGQPLGSELIGQPFDDPMYFWGRPSATGPVPYNAGASSGSNLAIGNPAQLDAIKARVEKLRAADAAAGVTREPAERIPIDLVTASGSGLDPHISPAAAEYQAPRVAAVRALPVERVRQMIAEATDGRQLGLLGDPRVNVLRLNLALELAGPSGPQGARRAP